MKTSHKIYIAVISISITLASLGYTQSLETMAVQEVKVALIGDTDAGKGFASVLSLIASEKANVIVINGDLGYSSSAEAWKNQLKASIDTDTYPVIGALGNHDVRSKGAASYIAIFDGLRTDQNGLKSKCTGATQLVQGQDIVAVDETCTFENVSIIESGIGQVLTKPYLENRLEEKLKAAPQDNWKLVGYHFTLANMTPGLKSDENTYKFFDLIRQFGAIGAQAHTHSAMASCPVSSTFAKKAAVKCHPDFVGDLDNRFVLPGTGIFLDSSVGGKELRKRKRCKKGTEADCTHMIDLITLDGYTKSDGTSRKDFNGLGAMFVIFNAGGDPSKALVYFKSIDGQEIFKFTITR